MSLTQEDYDVCRENLENCLNFEISSFNESYKVKPDKGPEQIYQKANLCPKSGTPFKTKDSEGKYKDGVYKSNSLILKFPCQMSNIGYNKQGGEEGDKKDKTPNLSCILSFRDAEEIDKDFAKWMTSCRETSSKTGYIEVSCLETLGESVSGADETGKNFEYYTYKGKTEIEIFDSEKKTIEKVKGSSKRPVYFMVPQKKKKDADIIEVKYGWTNGYFERLRENIARAVFEDKEDKDKKRKVKSVWSFDKDLTQEEYLHKIGSHDKCSKNVITYFQRDKESKKIKDPETASPVIFAEIKNYSPRTMKNSKGEEYTTKENKAEITFKGTKIPIETLIKMSSEGKRMFFGYVYLLVNLQSRVDDATNLTKIKVMVDGFDIISSQAYTSGGGSASLRDSYVKEENTEDESDMSETDKFMAQYLDLTPVKKSKSPVKNKIKYEKEEEEEIKVNTKTKTPTLDNTVNDE
jgi:hypothetical protein